MSKDLLEKELKIREEIDDLLRLAWQKTAVRRYQLELAKKIIEETDKISGEIDNLIKRAKELVEKVKKE